MDGGTLARCAIPKESSSMLAAMTVGMYGISTFNESRPSTFFVFSHTSISRLARTPLFLNMGVSQRA